MLREANDTESGDGLLAGSSAEEMAVENETEPIFDSEAKASAEEGKMDSTQDLKSMEESTEKQMEILEISGDSDETTETDERHEE